MLIRLTQSINKIPIFLRILIFLAIILGVFFRFYDLDEKLYSNDETFSTTYIFGWDLAQTGAIDNRIVSVEELKNFQRLNPNENLVQSIDRLIHTPYIFPPLYPILMQIWSRLWIGYSGSPASVTRSLTAFISLFCLIGIYWLCWELSRSSIMAWLATSLVAISPFHLQYAQIVRTYSLTTVAILLSSAALLRAIRLNTKTSWLIYAIMVAGGLYSNLLFGFVAVAHGFYTILLENLRLTKAVKFYIYSSAIGIACFLPWFILFITRPGLLGYSVEQVNNNLSLASLGQIWMRQIRPIFFDFNDPWQKFTDNFQILQKLSYPFILILVFISLFLICFHSPRNLRLFILSILFFGGIILMIKDVLIGGTFSTRLRYIIPYVIGLEVTVAYLLDAAIQSSFMPWKKIGEVAFTILIIGGILSCVIIARADSWWAFGAPDYPHIARKINQEFSRPVILYEDWGDALTMSYLLNENASSHLTRKPEFYLIKEKGKAYEKFSDIILFKPSKKIKNELNKSAILKLKSLFKSSDDLPSRPDIWMVKRI
jgi:uncharacterized membrane protein